MSEGFVIAIDGPVASGKGTIAPLLAKRLNGFYLQTGAMYRAVALFCLENGIDLANNQAVINSLSQIKVDFSESGVLLNGEDVTGKLRHEEVSKGSSLVALIPEVRERLVVEQQKIAKEKLDKGLVIVAEGRDTATRVFPDAAISLFLTASAGVRAKRRQKQIENQTGKEINLEHVLLEVESRDKQDSERSIDPLVSDPVAHGYLVLDNSELTEEETLNNILNLLKEKGFLND